MTITFMGGEPPLGMKLEKTTFIITVCNLTKVDKGPGVNFEIEVRKKSDMEAIRDYFRKDILAVYVDERLETYEAQRIHNACRGNECPNEQLCSCCEQCKGHCKCEKPLILPGKSPGEQTSGGRS